MSKPSVKVSAKKRKRKPVPVRSIDDVLSPQEELFVELYFALGFDVKAAYARACGKQLTSSSISSLSYRKLNEPPIQAAIQRRRDTMRQTHAATREEKLQILETIMRDAAQVTRDRMQAIYLHSRLTGEDAQANQQPGPRENERLTYTALQAMSAEELIVQINRGMISKARGQITDVTPLHGNGNGNGHTNGHQ